MSYEFRDIFKRVGEERLEGENTYRDPTTVSPIQAQIQRGKKDIISIELARWIRTKMFGIDVRESLARFVEWISVLTNQTIDKTEQTSKRQNDVEQRQDDTEKDVKDFKDDFNRRYDEQIAGNTDLNEVIDARGGELTLNKRLSKMQHMVDSGIEYVTYSMFGVNSQKKYYNPSNNKYYLDEDFINEYDNDDGIKIKQAHQFASDNNLPIKVSKGCFLIKETRRIPITTNIDFGDSTFYIQEDGRAWWDNVFEVTGDEEIKIDANKINLPIKKGTTSIPELSDFEGSFVVIEDKNDITMMRSDNGIVHHNTQLFVVEKNGELISEITKDVHNITSIIAKKIHQNHLIITGGTFLYDGNFKSTLSGPSNGFYIDRSKVKISNQFVGILGSDESEGQFNGFYRPDNVYDFELSNVRVVPRSNNGNSTYGLTGEKVLQYKIIQVTALGDKSNWGVMGTNYIKDLIIKDSRLTRVDVHYGAHNIFIENSVLGGINVTGSGRLSVNNTQVYNNFFISFRGDYGSMWDGDIYIYESKLVVENNNSVGIISFQAKSNHNFGTDLVFGRNIHIKNFSVDYLTNNDKEAYLYSRSGSVNLNDVYMPETMSFENVHSNRSIGFIFLNTLGNSLRNKSRKVNTIRSIEPNDINIDTNATWSFKNIHTTYVVGTPKDFNTKKHITFWSGASPYNLSESNIVPEITIENCNGISVVSENVLFKLVIKNSTINTLNSNGYINVSIENSDIKPNYNASKNETDDSKAITLKKDQLSILNVNVYPTYHNGVKNLGYTVGKNGLFDINWKKGTYTVTAGKFLGVTLLPEIVRSIREYNLSAYKGNQLLEHLRLSAVGAENIETEY
ncbi:hypothetical protein CL176_02040 [Suicoccus acidiformans]|uniref:Uncharacterized protein n=1 Tax=Suicoccus acidiformans TaxID=2036206 RepID=A0A347WIJ2_9LACT|nr:hypothetical protein [Suicoccus acidiformans]AXY24899.1 hypothetical protein CL176_02040 [Suicoccus acidiformans]